MTSGSMAIPINNYNEGVLIKKAIESEKFKDFIKSCMWGNFRIEWRLFTYLKRDFYKYFLNDE
jgi:hypothetical protein